jgi:hypothetical protein
VPGAASTALVAAIACVETPDTIPWNPSAAGSGGTAGINAAGTGTAGASVVAGSAGTSAVLDPATIPCDFPTILQSDCAHSGCHAPSAAAPTPAAGLDLSPNAGLVGRLKDVPARHMNINCAPPGADIVECTSVPAACPTGALLVDSSNWEASFVVSKMRGTALGCGDQMREPDYPTLKADREACVEAVVKAIAALPK